MVRTTEHCDVSRAPAHGAAGANGTAANAVAQFGAPVRTARIGGYEVLVWNHDLLPAVTGGFARGCGPPWLAAEHVGG